MGPAYSVIVAFLLYVAVLARIRPLTPGRRASVSAFVIADVMLLWWLSQATSPAGIVVRAR